MHRIIVVIIFCGLAVGSFCSDVSGAWPWDGSKSLVTINGTSYTADDYKHWWENWREPQSKPPQDMQPFIEWKLLAQEAESMELDQAPAFNRHVRVFLKARARMSLKYEAVDSRIKITEQDVRLRFEQEYSPVSMVTVLNFVSKESADNAYRNLTDNTLSFNELLKRPIQEGGPHKTEKKQFYPKTLKNRQDKFADIKQFSVGEISAPHKRGHFFVIYRLDEQLILGDNGFNKYKKRVRRSIIDEKQAAYTNELVTQLWEKFDVQVDENLFDQAAVNITGEVLKRPIVTTNRENIPFALLVKDIQKEYRMRDIDSWSDEDKKKLFRGLLNGMIIEYLITWESMDRHYEDKPPFKWSYQFYRESKLIGELENRLIAQEIKLNENDILEYYENHLDQYRNPVLVTIVMLEDEQQLIDRLWKEINQGQDFLEVAKRYYANLVPMKDIPVDDLAPEKLAVVQQLEIGATAPPFLSKDGRYVLVKLLNRKPGDPMPLKSVRGTVISELRKETFRKMRREYLTKVLAQSQIDVNQRAWDKLKADLAGNG
jgi:hypothetical protein